MALPCLLEFDMNSIYKYAIQPNSSLNGEFVINIRTHVGAKPLSVHMQRGEICVWMEVDTTQKLTILKLYSIGTGFGQVKAGRTFLGTVLHGDYVWHIYY